MLQSFVSYAVNAAPLVSIVFFGAKLWDQSKKKHYSYISIGPKPQVRMLRLNRNSIAEFVTVDIEQLSELTYTALSYTWNPDGGSSSFPNATIRIEGPGNSGLIRISEHLSRFIEAFRKCITSAETAQFIYIDALCIDQSNQEEKADQVQLMREVYMSASQTIVWLNDRGGTEREMNSLYDLQRAPYVEIGDDNMRHQEAVNYMCRQTYWQRLWIVQEFLLSRDIRIWINEELHFGWKDIYQLIRRYESYDRVKPGSGPHQTTFSSPNLHIRRIMDAKMEFDRAFFIGSGSKWQEGMPMRDAIQRFGTQKCSDKKDNVYGLLGLVKNRRVKVRYNGDWTFVNVIKQVIDQAWDEIRDDADCPQEDQGKHLSEFQNILMECFPMSRKEQKVIHEWTQIKLNGGIFSIYAAKYLGMYLIWYVELFAILYGTFGNVISISKPLSWVIPSFKFLYSWIATFICYIVPLLILLTYSPQHH